MFRFFRKHSWILIVVIGLTVVSLLWFMGTPNRGRGGSGGEADLGTIYGHQITPQEYQQAKNDFELFFRVNEGAWPESSRSLSPLQVDQQIYLNLMLIMKAKSLGIYVSDQAVINAAAQMLSSTGFNRSIGNKSNHPIEMSQLVDQVLKPHNLTDLDFQNYVRTQLVVEQLRLALGLSGALITPAEAAAIYDHDHALVTVEAAFFSASNYLDRVSAPPAVVGEYFTNYMANYRLPDRVQVNYVWFNITNFMAQSKAEWAETNFDAVIDNAYHQADLSQLDAKTPEEAKAKIRESLIKYRANQDLAVQARDFISTLYAMNPVKPDNFIAVAKAKGLTVRTSNPFSQSSGDEEFPNAPGLAENAFALTPDSPFSDAMGGTDGAYVMGLAAQLPSSMPAFEDIRDRVAMDLKMGQALAMAREAATNFNLSATVQLATGKTFAQAAVAHGIAPVAPEPFSLNSSDIPEIGDHAEMGPFKQASFSTPVGNMSRVFETDEGAFVVFVKSLAPPDAAAKAADLPAYTSDLRRGRESEAFNLWINTEASHELSGIPALQRPDAAAH